MMKNEVPWSWKPINNTCSEQYLSLLKCLFFYYCIRFNKIFTMWDSSDNCLEQIQWLNDSLQLWQFLHPFYYMEFNCSGLLANIYYFYLAWMCELR